MSTFVVRVWMPDRPGALGAVASRIGAVRGDLIGVDILERGAGRAIDELVVQLPGDDLVPLLVSEIGQVDGVDVEDVRPASPANDARLDGLETAASLVAQVDVSDLLGALVARSAGDFDAEWAAVVDLQAPAPVVTEGHPPPGPWLGAFVAGSRASLSSAAASVVPSSTARSGGSEPEDVAWADLAAAGLVVVLGRKGRPFRARERRQLAALARIVDLRWAELVTRTSRPLHRSGTD